MKKVLLFLLMATPLHAVIVPKDATTEYLTDQSGGLNSNEPSHKLKSNFSPYMRNVFVDNGKLERVGGFVIAGSSFTLQKVTGIYPYVKEDGTTKFLVTDSSITLQTSDFNTWVLVSSASNTGAVLRWTQVRNKMWGHNGIDFVRVWDDTTLTILNGNPNPLAVSTPNVPKFKYLAYDLNRVWGLNAPAAASDMYFTSVISTEARILAPDDYLAWPVINAISVGAGDGQVGTALWVYDGQLRIGKERSIYTRYGDSPTNFNVRKEEASVGVASQDSVVVMDGKSHFVGQDGIYKNVNRISDLIVPDFEAINKDTQKVLRNTWETQSDFAKGQFWGTTVTVSGLVEPTSTTFYANRLPAGQSIPVDQLGNTRFQGGSAVQFTQFYSIVSSETTGSLIAYPQSITIYCRLLNNGGPATIDMVFRNKVSKQEMRLRKSVANTGLFQAVTWSRGDSDNPVVNPPPAYFTSEDMSSTTFQGMANSSFTIQITTAVDLNSGSGGIFDIQYATQVGGADIIMAMATTGQYMSEVSTLASVTAWGNFSSVFTANGGLVNYYYRTSTSVVNISTQLWSSVTPGVILNAPLINNYIQWASTISSLTTDPSMSSNIDNVTIDHIEGGGAINRPFAVSWKNRYWLATSTTSDQVKSLIYVKSMVSNATPDAWMPVEGIDIRAFGKNGDTLYGGSSSTGTVYRLDFGTNYNGVAIKSIYDFPDMVMDSPYFDKALSMFVIDGEKSIGASLNFQYSLNQRSFTSKSFSISGTGRYSKLITGVADNGSFKTLRVRLENSQLDSTFIVYNLGIIYSPTSVLTDK